MNSQRNLLQRVAQSINAAHINAADRLLTLAPPCTIVGVRDVMTARIIYVDSSRSIEECMAIMTQERIRHLPVVDGKALAGVISIGDLVKFLSKEREVEIRYLTEYITGRPGG